jgi:hypothetical protein
VGGRRAKRRTSECASGSQMSVQLTKDLPLTIDDARDYIFPLFLVPAEENAIRMEPRKFLGTAFFVSKRGDAITAGHVMPPPANLEPGHRVVAVIFREGREEVCWVTHAAAFQQFDVALLHVNASETKFLPISVVEVVPGTDVALIGIPDHEVWGAGKEMRILKGHVTMASRGLELSCPVPRGMSGSPVFANGVVVGYATGNVRSEELDDSLEEHTETTAAGTLTKRTEIKRVVHYGIARDFLSLAEVPDPILEGQSLPAFIRSRNAAS